MTALEPVIRALAVNAVAAAALVPVAVLATRRLRWPAAVHLIWLAVLLRMVVPPVLPVPILSASVAAPEGLATVTGSVLGLAASPVPTAPGPRRIAVAVWIGGMVAVLALALVRSRRLRRLLGEPASADGRVADRVAAVAGRLGVRPPRTVLVGGRVPPMLWAVPGRPTLLLPDRLVSGLDPHRLDALLAHELAHLVRRDHWVRWLELTVTVVCWWNPVTWWARCQLRRAEERCADELVSRTFPEHARAYADTLVATLRFLAGSRIPVAVPSVGMADLSEIQRRLEMILSPNPLRRRPAIARLVLLGALAAFLVLSPQSKAGESEPQKEYTGERITLSLEQADLADVLLTFGRIAGYEILTEPGISGTVTLDITDQPWDQALDTVLSRQGLTSTLEHGTLKVFRQQPATPRLKLAGVHEGDDVFRYEDGILSAPVKVSGPLPVYPQAAREERVTGAVVLDTLITADGRTADVAVLRSPDDRLSKAALDAVRDWVFEPATTEDGKPVAVRYTLTVAFRLE